MRTMPASTGLAALAAALGAAPAEAAPQKAWARVGEWQVTPFRLGICHVRRDYPGGTYMSVRKESEGPGELLVLNRGWSFRIPGRYRLTLILDGRRVPLPPPPGPEDYWQGLAGSIGADSLAALARGGGTIEVQAPDGRLLERLDVAGLGAAVERLGDCASKAATADAFPVVAAPPPPAPPGLVTPRPARARANLVSLFSSDDYPESAWQAGEEGRVGFRLQVDEAGGVAGCSIVSSSGSPTLDSTTCRLLTERARFEPARDHRGRPTADSLVGAIVWRIPEPEPPPPPPG